MIDLTKTYDTRTLELPAPKGEMLRVGEALTHQAKNLRNTGNFLIRQVLSAYDYDAGTQTSTLKSELHPLQRQAIGHINATIDAVNAKRVAAHPGKLATHAAKKACGEAVGKAPVLEIVPRLETKVDSPAKSVLDLTVLDNALKTWKDEKGNNVYRRLAVAMAQQVVRRLSESYTGFFGGLKQFNDDPSDMTGRPQMPGYLDRNGRFVLEVPFVNVKAALPKPQKAVPVPENDFVLSPSHLTKDMLDAFYGYDIRKAVMDACLKRGWKEFSPQHIRIVPMRRGLRLEVVGRMPNPYPDGSFLARLVAEHAADLSKLKDDKARDKWLLAHLGGMAADALPRIAGIDPGRKNLATISYTTGCRAAVHLGGEFTAKMEDFSARIGRRVSELTGDRARELQAKKLELQKAGKKLNRAEGIELATLLKAIYRDAEVIRLTGKMNRWSGDYLHKVSTAIVRDCVEHGIEVIVLGRNKGWKNGGGMSRRENRKFHQVSHATLGRLIRYKAESHGIAVVETEESYTSKSSFVNGDTLRTFGEEPVQGAPADETHDEAATSTPAGESGAPAPALTGTRNKADRNRFRNHNRDDRWKWVHADVNGAFNIIRKVFGSFAYNDGLTLKFKLLRVSPRMGVTPVRLRPCA